MTNDEANAILSRAADQLGEHFEAVQILASWPDAKGAGTRSLNRGSGNWFARQGMAHEFIALDQALTQAKEISRAIEPPPDDGDAWKQPSAP